MVAIPIPVIPKDGIGPNPKMNNGFNAIFKKKLKISIFLNVIVSPSACNNEFKATTKIKNIDPENITSVYFNPKFITLLDEPINEKISGAKNKPIKVTKIDKIIPYTIVCPKYLSTFSLFFSPILLAINEVPPTVTPTEAAINIKYIGKDLARADSASDEIFPA